MMDDHDDDCDDDDGDGDDDGPRLLVFSTKKLLANSIIVKATHAPLPAFTDSMRGSLRQALPTLASGYSRSFS